MFCEIVKCYLGFRFLPLNYDVILDIKTTENEEGNLANKLN